MDYYINFGLYIYILTDDELVESVKCMKEISFCHSQHSTITTLTLAKYKLEQLHIYLFYI
jgi:hypothetical protein